MKKLVLSLVVVATLGLGLVSCKVEKKKEVKAEAATEEVVEEKMAAKEEVAASYTCPMACEEGKTYTEAGKCTTCKMDLTKVDAACICTDGKNADCKHSKCVESTVACICKDGVKNADCKKCADKVACICKDGVKNADCKKCDNKTAHSCKGEECKTKCSEKTA
ncbi:MAG: hypothetical protein HRT66_02460 [Flavobacteriaceae bacterium]|nr:hypothetical protein [Flavobacteriaceae bacterium]